MYTDEAVGRERLMYMRGEKSMKGPVTGKI
ncbi:MAG: hypothetical protein CM1200mP41_08330 [Gammaproteobacteria bacterium]|nr:MAG: hypothetical protein CM1200mP41_08330 [Gammaproteobacteria bacterium]